MLGYEILASMFGIEAVENVGRKSENNEIYVPKKRRIKEEAKPKRDHWLGHNEKYRKSSEVITYNI